LQKRLEFRPGLGWLGREDLHGGGAQGRAMLYNEEPGEEEGSSESSEAGGV
jgi:hypothetical protein